MIRRQPNDAYDTPAFQTRALLDHVTVTGRALEPCAGRGAMVRVLQQELTACALVATDIHPLGGTPGYDASRPDVYTERGPFNWVITNPPYMMPLCWRIVAQAVRHAPNVAMLLRLSFLEPPRSEANRQRAQWLAANPPTRMLVLPRYSYVPPATDSVTTAWMIWHRELPPRTPHHQPIVVVHDAERRYNRVSK